MRNGLPIDTLQQSGPESPQLPMHRAAPQYKNSAAFYDVDGTLIQINIVHAFAFYASRHASLSESARRTIQTALSVPVFWAADKLSRKWFNEIFYRSYAGQGEDRLVVLMGEEKQRPTRRAQNPLARDVGRMRCHRFEHDYFSAPE